MLYIFQTNVQMYIWQPSRVLLTGSQNIPGIHSKQELSADIVHTQCCKLNNALSCVKNVE